MNQVRETTRDATFLHNEQFFAAAQKKYVYVYNKRGIEIHCLKVCKGFTFTATANTCPQIRHFWQGVASG